MPLPLHFYKTKHPAICRFLQPPALPRGPRLTGLLAGSSLWQWKRFSEHSVSGSLNNTEVACSDMREGPRVARSFFKVRDHLRVTAAPPPELHLKHLTLLFCDQIHPSTAIMTTFTRIPEDQTPCISIDVSRRLAKINPNIYGGFTE